MRVRPWGVRQAIPIRRGHARPMLLRVPRNPVEDLWDCHVVWAHPIAHAVPGERRYGPLMLPDRWLYCSELSMRRAPLLWMQALAAIREMHRTRRVWRLPWRIVPPSEDIFEDRGTHRGIPVRRARAQGPPGRKLFEGYAGGDGGEGLVAFMEQHYVEVRWVGAENGDLVVEARGCVAGPGSATRSVTRRSVHMALRHLRRALGSS